MKPMDQTVTDWMAFFEQEAHTAFHALDQFQGLIQREKALGEVCRQIFTNEEFAKIKAWVDSILALKKEEGHYLYQKGYADGLALVKSFGMEQK